MIQVTKTWSPVQHKPAPPPTGPDYVTLYFTAAYARSQDPLWLANVQSASPSSGGISRLPGADDAAKVEYALDYIAAGMNLGCSAYDMISERHDADLRLAHPTIGGVQITDPAKAAQDEFPNGGRLDLIEGNLNREIAFDPNWKFETAPQYRNFWVRYGMS